MRAVAATIRPDPSADDNGMTRTLRRSGFRAMSRSMRGWACIWRSNSLSTMSDDIGALEVHAAKAIAANTMRPFHAAPRTCWSVRGRHADLEGAGPDANRHRTADRIRHEADDIQTPTLYRKRTKSSRTSQTPAGGTRYRCLVRRRRRRSLARDIQHRQRAAVAGLYPWSRPSFSLGDSDPSSTSARAPMCAVRLRL